ncbi:hypothetical protein Tco_1125413 [Tanacetum coccineum]|uniref:Integrase, catalytic region, zinc finger, CCHC-type, peptidase aspartic, catalytic n=1 Tax=Tanacetum coccineum TaxID=301880 RepID=A0ABQ5JBY6_9ASTR
MSQDVMLCVMNSTAIFGDYVNLEMKSSESYDKCFDLDAELLKNQNAHNELLKSYSQLEKHCISLELSIQLNQEIFQKDKSYDNQNALEIPEYFKINDLKAQLQAKDTTICKLKEHIKSMRENNKEEKVKQKTDEIKTINIELEHSVAKLLPENELLHKEIEHLKKIYKDQFDSIKKTRALSKEHCDSLIVQLNSKSMKNVDLKGQIQEKVFMTTILQNELRILKGTHVLDNATTITNATTIAPWMFKLDLDPLAPRFGNDQIAKIMGYGDYQLVNVTISRVYYVAGLGHNLFSVGQFCDSNLEVATRKNTCFIWNLDGVDLLSGSRDTNLYTISLDDMLKTSSICLLSKASKTKS